MYKVYINGLLKELSDHCFAISINTLLMPAPSFAVDIYLIDFHQSLLKILMNKCHNYSKTWRYEFIILKVVSSLLVRLNLYIANQRKNVSGLSMMTRSRNSTSIRILVC